MVSVRDSWTNNQTALTVGSEGARPGSERPVTSRPADVTGHGTQRHFVEVVCCVLCVNLVPWNYPITYWRDWKHQQTGAVTLSMCPDRLVYIDLRQLVCCKQTEFYKS